MLQWHTPETDVPREKGFWEKDIGGLPHVPALDSDLCVDIAIVGSGITGLSAALTIRELSPGATVCILDSHRPCSGSSAKNSGFLLGESHAWEHIFSTKGPDAAAQCNRFTQRGLDTLIDFIHTNGIECNLRQEPFLLAARKHEMRALKKRSAQMKLLGLDGTLLEGESFQNRAKTNYYWGAIERQNQYLMHPGKLMKGILGCVLDQGVPVFGNTPVLSVTSTDSTHDTNILRTPRGCVTAKKVIFATNAYTPRMNGLLSCRMVPLIVSVAATRPMTAHEKAAAGFEWNHLREIRLMNRTFGVTHDNRIFIRGVFGCASFDSCIWKSPEKGYTRLERELQERLPYSANLDVTEHWYGAVCINRSGVPMVGPLKNPGQYVCTCFNGVGMVDGFYHARLLVHQMMKIDHPDTVWLKGPYETGIVPPEPLRSVGAKPFFFFGLLR
jgi:glycine/D-amino acid oxidase-like deaminating enzyme